MKEKINRNSAGNSLPSRPVPGLPDLTPDSPLAPNPPHPPTDRTIRFANQERARTDLEQYGAMRTGSHGKYGSNGIVFSVTYRFYSTNAS